MNSKVPVKPFLYVSLLIAYFLVLVLLDLIFGLHYEPVAYDLGKDTLQPSIATIDPLLDTIMEFDSLGTIPSIQADAGDPLGQPVLPDSLEDDLPVEGVDPSGGDVSPSEYFHQLLSVYKRDIQDKLDKNKARQDIVIRYYHHEPDGNSAYALSKLGYYIHEREVDPEYANYQSNAIFYGDSVLLRDVQVVAYTLLKEGLPIKIIKPSKFHDSWKAHSIEIGTDTTAIHLTTISLEQVQQQRL